MEISPNTQNETDMQNTVAKTDKWSKSLVVFGVISFIIALIPIMHCFIGIQHFETQVKSLFFLIPPIILFLINYFSAKNSFKFSKLKKILIVILNVVIVSAIQIFIGFCFLALLTLDDMWGYPDKVYTHPQEYNAALESINSQYRIQHFPASIPEDAKDVYLNKDSNSFFGSEGIVLRFTINKKYIDNELQRYEFISIEKPNHYEHSFERDVMYHPEVKGNDEYTFYVINDKANEKLCEHCFVYHYGIGVNKQHNKIIYYYTCPD